MITALSSRFRSSPENNNAPAADTAEARWVFSFSSNGHMAHRLAPIAVASHLWLGKPRVLDFKSRQGRKESIPESKLFSFVPDGTILFRRAIPAINDWAI